MPSLHWPSSRPATRPPTRPGSPTRTHSSAPSEDFPHQLTEALHATSSSTMIPPSHGPHPDDATSSRHAHSSPTLEIVLGQEYIHLKGTGRDVDPATLAGTIVLNLTERTSIKGITLQFRGKARLPMHSHDPLALHSHHATYVVCDHEWSFLEGTKAHSHTLKAGRHVFPFSVEIGGTLPSSIYTHVFGGAHVAYKLRATATRPGLAHNLSAVTPVTVLRGPGPDTLEFQQTLEIENTWPEKIMYAIALPHKAWALGDNVAALMKFEPLAKGAKVLSVITTINETVKMCPKSGVPTSSHESTRAVVSIKHEIQDGKAVVVEGPTFGRARALGLPAPVVSTAHSAPPTPGPSASRPSHDISPVCTPSPGPSTAAEYFPTPAAGPSTSSPNLSSSTNHSTSDQPAPPQLAGAQDLQLPPELELDEPSTSTITTLSIPLPSQSGLTPSHSLDPIHTSHRIRWSILIGNADGHTSELRCSLPLLVLDTRLLESARAATLETRRLLLGAQEDDDAENTEEMDLPSYPAHVRDRVANMYVPASATVRVPGSGTRTPHTGTHSSGRSSPDPHAPVSANSGVDAPDALEWVTDELRQLAMAGVTVAPARTSPEGSVHQSQAGSRWGSRHPSRASSPTPPEHPPPATIAPATGSASTSATVPPSVSAAESTYVHAGPASRAPQGVFTAQMRPLTSLASSISSSFAGGSRSGSAGSLANYFASHAHSGPVYSPVHGPMSPTREHAHIPRSGSLDVGNTPGGMEGLTRVPGYASSSRGFMGGVPPLSSVVGLPSYAEAERQRG